MFEELLGGPEEPCWPFEEQMRVALGSRNWSKPECDQLSVGDHIDVQVTVNMDRTVWLDALITEVDSESTNRVCVQHAEPCANWVTDDGKMSKAHEAVLSSIFDQFAKASEISQQRLERMFTVAHVDAQVPVATIVMDWLQGRQGMSRAQFLERYQRLWGGNPGEACEHIRRLGFAEALEAKAGQASEWLTLPDSRTATWQSHPHAWRRFRDFRKGDCLSVHRVHDEDVEGRVLSVDWERMTLEIMTQPPNDASPSTVMRVNSGGRQVTFLADACVLSSAPRWFQWRARRYSLKATRA